MVANHLELLVEELSMEAFLRALLPRLLPQDRSFEVHAFQGKTDLMKKLKPRLLAYAKWLPEDWRILVVVDRDDDNCTTLKQKMVTIAHHAGLRTRNRAGGPPWQLVNRIAIEELEAWYFGDWGAVRAAYPRVKNDIPRRRAFRDPDKIAGGTWEAFERVMQRYGYFPGGLAKIEAARAIGVHLQPERSRSRSFVEFHHALIEAVTGES